MKHENQANRIINRIWNGLPVVDAKKDLRVIVRPEDLAKATRKNPYACIFAQACIRLFGSRSVIFFRNVAYVEVPDENGKRHIERFALPTETRKQIVNFDLGLQALPEASFLLAAPSRHNKLGARAKRDQRWNEKRREMRAAGVYGTAEQPRVRKPVRSEIIGQIRHGSGHVQFVRRERATE